MKPPARIDSAKVLGRAWSDVPIGELSFPDGTIAVPNNPALVGIPVYAQFAFLGPNSPSPPCPASGLSSSGGLEVNAIP